jgi:DMSO/TMAO reductase YedYZ heme-binding membrane subunit
VEPAARPSKEPLGGRSGNRRHRLLRFHIPLALASALGLVVFMSLPLFDADAYPHVDITSDTFPQQRGEGGSMEHGGDDSGARDHSGGERGAREHGGDERGARDHGESGSAEDGREHGGDEAGSNDHGGDRGEARDDGGGHGGRRAGPFSFDRRFTVATGYIALGLLAITLLIGTANLLLRRPNPVSNYLARDIGTWAAIASVVHVFYGLQLEGGFRNSLNMFVAPDGSPLTNSFGLGNWTGLAATVIVVGLLATSSNFALRKLKARRWKRIQRLNYALFALAIAHAFFYGALLRLESPYTGLLLLSAIAVFVGQAVGIWLWRRRYGPGVARQQA